MAEPHPLTIVLAEFWDSPCHLSLHRDTEVMGAPGEIHSTLGTGDNYERESEK